MLYNDSDDDLPDIPMVPRERRSSQGNVAAASPCSVREDQLKRLQTLEDQFRQLREEMTCQPLADATPTSVLTTDTNHREGAAISRRRSRRAHSASVDRHDVGESSGTGGAQGPSSASPTVGEERVTSSGTNDGCLAVQDCEGDNSEARSNADSGFRDEEIQYELRRLVPHLSPDFSCGYRDAVLLVAAIRNGGSSSVRGQESLMDRISANEAERRSLDVRLTKKTDECAELRVELEHSRQKMRAMQQQAQQSTALLSQKREEMRKQLLIEESRTEKLQVKNKKLERENEDLKSRLRAHMR